MRSAMSVPPRSDSQRKYGTKRMAPGNEIRVPAMVLKCLLAQVATTTAGRPIIQDCSDQLLITHHRTAKNMTLLMRISFLRLRLLRVAQGFAKRQISDRRCGLRAPLYP